MLHRAKGRSDLSVDVGQYPKHIAIVMDGNGRWANERGLPRRKGHQSGYETVRGIVRFALQRDIEHLTLFAFSSENWRRPRAEVDALMLLFMQALRSEVRELHEQQIRLDFIGSRERLSAYLQKAMREAEEMTAANNRLTLHIALSYGGRWDILNAARRLAEEAAAGKVEPEKIDETRLRGAMALAHIPDPDLFIRTGGECRISNFLLWNLAYTELYFTDTLWPDFDEKAFEKALEDYSRRQRRFGRVAPVAKAYA